MTTPVIERADKEIFLAYIRTENDGKDDLVPHEKLKQIFEDSKTKFYLTTKGSTDLIYDKFGDVLNPCLRVVVPECEDKSVLKALRTALKFGKYHFDFEIREFEERHLYEHVRFEIERALLQSIRVPSIGKEEAGVATPNPLHVVEIEFDIRKATGL